MPMCHICQTIAVLWFVAIWQVGVIWNFPLTSFLVSDIIKNPIKLFVFWILDVTIVQLVKVIPNGGRLYLGQVLCSTRNAISILVNIPRICLQIWYCMNFCTNLRNGCDIWVDDTKFCLFCSSKYVSLVGE